MYRHAMGKRRSGMFRFVGFLAWLLALSLTPSYAYTTYSDATLQGTTIVAWAVTDVTDYQYEHWAEVQVSLTSPDGRSVSSSNVVDLNSARVQVSLPWDEDDLGNYSLRSWHTATCSEMGTFLDVLKTLSFKVGVAAVCYASSGNQYGFETYKRVANSCARCPGPETIIVGGDPTPFKLVKRAYVRIAGYELCVTFRKLSVPCIGCGYVEIGP